MATLAAQITELEAELVLVKSQIASVRASGQSSSIEGISISRASLSGLVDERTRIEKSLQRLYRGGRGMVVDMSYGTGTAVTGG
jgi:hypothetical protein